MKKNLRHYSVRLLEEVGALVVEVAVLVVTVERFSSEFGVWNYLVHKSRLSHLLRLLIFISNKNVGYVKEPHIQFSVT